ncbi:PVC-type heme-binding CxxCH protein [Thalassoroseus pseudoceratinae]|uniref:PVC-type heme-binding CxxCH protein n=1 Tax=Thalassoroseus pseudoceratinae TaxID=2713176 RepID=UPI001422F855|nr:PVC-type heme-binding CxxCH protein [Thalassoroseus pseudoceratinae]
MLSFPFHCGHWLRGAMLAGALIYLTTPLVKAAEPVFKSPVITESTPGHEVKIDINLNNAKSLYLVVRDGGDGFSCDWANWGNPRVTLADGEEIKLTELKWKAAKSGWGNVNVGKNCGGRPMQVLGVYLEDGIGTHANSVIQFELAKPAKKFQATGSLDDGGANQPGTTSVQFYVYTEKPPQRVLATASKSGGGDLPPGEALDGLDVADDLAVSLFAHEPMLLSPSNIDIDHLGRVWVCEIVNYRQFRNKDTPERKEGDRILILEDTDGDAKADKSTTFYQGRDIDSAHGVCVLGNKVIVSAGDSVFVLTDDDGDSKADRKDVLFTKIDGTQHDHGIHSFLFGPDGKLYFNFGNAGRRIHDKNGNVVVDMSGREVHDHRKPYQEGMVFRCNLDGSEFETLGWNFRNNWELAVDSFGNIWQSDNDDDGNRGVRINFVMEFGNYGYKDEFTGAGWRDERTGWSEEIPKRHWHLNDPGVVPNLLQTGAGSPTGICVYEGDLLPKQYRGEIIHCDAGPNIVRAYPAKVDGAGYTADIINMLSGTRDKWFRPSDVCVAPDGSLIVADWYDPGVGGHRMADIQKGRLFRLTPKEMEYKSPKFDFESLDGAIEALQSPNMAARYLAWTSLHEMGVKAEKALVDMFQTHDDPRMQARALWLLTKLEGRGYDHAAEALTHDDPNIRIVALRAIRQMSSASESDRLLNVLESLSHDPSAAVRRECAIALRAKKSDKAADIWATLTNEYDGDDRWYLEALGIGAEGQWDRFFETWLKTDAVSQSPGLSKAEKDIIWRSRSAQALPLLATAILDEDTSDSERLKHFRAFDFHRDPAERELKTNTLLTLLAGNHPDQTQIAALSLKHLGKLSGAQREKLLPMLNEVVSRIEDPERVVALTQQFGLSQQYPRLLQIARENPAEQAGVEAMRALLAAEQTELLEKALASTEDVQATAVATALGYSNHGRATKLLMQTMNNKKAGLAVRRASVTGLSKFKGGAERLVELAKADKLDKKLTDAAAAGLHASQYPHIKQAAEKLFPLPPTKNNKPLPPIEHLVSQRGDVKRGRVLFNTEATCVKCHIVNGVGREVGPNLSEIGKKLSRQAMYQSILFPSAGISHNYESYTLLMTDGTQVTGLKTSETEDSVSIKDINALTRTYPKDDVEFMKKNETSLMPADLQKVMTEQDLVDVVEYLMTLTKAKEFHSEKASK